jgi:hypothetical protein
MSTGGSVSGASQGSRCSRSPLFQWFRPSAVFQEFDTEEPFPRLYASIVYVELFHVRMIS